VSAFNKLKILNDPIYGFITIPNPFIYDLIQHPYFQRLRRISQMGLSYLVYPGAHHTRFHHAIGAMHIMQKAIAILRFKEVQISVDEENALLIAILLHDMGHGPFSHAMEHSIVEKVSHESISLLFMHQLNYEFDGKLTLAIQIFKGEYPRKFMLQLISSQLDMDRMDYLKRDSFYSGVAEGNINSDRLIQMLHVVDEVLVMEEKGIYSVEKFLMARRLMYWQAYLHKTSLVAELILTKILKRAKELTQNGTKLSCSVSLQFFMENKVDLNLFTPKVLDLFAQLDDFDIISCLKLWQHHDDFILSSLSKMIINRDLLKIKLMNETPNSNEINSKLKAFSIENNCSLEEANYFVFNGSIVNQAYNSTLDPILILTKSKSVVPVNHVSDQLSSEAFSKAVTKFYICFPKQVTIN